MRLGSFRMWKRVAPIVLALLCLSCGDVYRPVAQPIPGPSPTPAATHYVYAIASNSPLDRGSMSRIDVAGDSVVSSISSGVFPVHAALTPSGTTLYVANSGDDTVSVSPNSLNTQGATVALISLCDSGGCPPITPVFVTTTESNRMYVADEGNGTVSVLDTTSNVVARTIAVDPAFAANPPSQPLPLPDRNAKPVDLAELPNGSKIYSVNQGNSTVTSINTVDGSIAKVIPFANPPIWAVAAADGTHLFVLDTSGTVSVIDTLSDAVVSSVSAGSGADYLLYDNVFNRLYVTVANPTTPLTQIYDISGSTLVPHGAAPVTISAATGSSCSSVPVPTSVAVLGDGTRAYVSSYQSDPNLICTQATVIDAGPGLATKTIALAAVPDSSSQTGCNTARFRTFATVSGGGANSNFKVYVAQCDAGTTAVIYTNAVNTGVDPHPADVFWSVLPSPVSSFSASQVSISDVSATTATSCPSPSTVTYTYSLLSGPPLQTGMTVYVSGMANPANDGTFVITSATASTFTVVNNCPVADASAQNGSGSVLPSQNPVFLVPGP
jgi:YVTN family beta-propeller protein